MRRRITAVFIIFMSLATIDQLFAEIPNLSIYELQYTENPGGSSYYDGQIVNCDGGIVIHKWSRGRERLILYDPNYHDGWGGVLVKGPFDSMVFEDVNMGDWISLKYVKVYEELDKTRGNTTLFYDEYSSHTILGVGHELPEPLVVDVNEIAVKYDPIQEICHVTDHSAEKYEAMCLRIKVASVGDVNVGSHWDNYSLHKIDEPNFYCWASDYMNIDNPDSNTPYPIIEIGLRLCSVIGILEQYTKLSDGWDYYQLLTTKQEDFQIQQAADLNRDCGVDFVDFGLFACHWLTGQQCVETDWCSGTDMTQNGLVNASDLSQFSGQWLEGR